MKKRLLSGALAMLLVIESLSMQVYASEVKETTEDVTIISEDAIDTTPSPSAEILIDEEVMEEASPSPSVEIVADEGDVELVSPSPMIEVAEEVPLPSETPLTVSTEMEAFTELSLSLIGDEETIDVQPDINFTSVPTYYGYYGNGGNYSSGCFIYSIAMLLQNSGIAMTPAQVYADNSNSVYINSWAALNSKYANSYNVQITDRITISGDYNSKLSQLSAALDTYSSGIMIGFPSHMAYAFKLNGEVRVHDPYNYNFENVAPNALGNELTIADCTYYRALTGGGVVRPNVISFDTYEVTNTSDTSATVSVWVDNSSAKTISSMGFVYGISQDNMQSIEVTQNVTWTRPHLIYDIGNYTTLSPNTNYYVKFYVTVEGTTYYSNSLNFRTSGVSFDTYSIENISDTTATISVWLDNPSAKAMSSMGFMYGTSQGEMQRVEVTKDAAWTRAHLIYDISSYVGALNTGTRYYYQFYIISDGQEYKSNINEFQTTGQQDVKVPVVENIDYLDVSKEQFTIVASVSDNVGVTCVKFPTWREDIQTGEDAIWIEGIKQSDGVWQATVQLADFGSAETVYTTHVYAYDAAGNYAYNEAKIYIDRTEPIISDVKIERLNEDAVKISCLVCDNKAIQKVVFPSWTINNGQDDMIYDWWNNYYGIKEGERWVFFVYDSEHYYEKGMYSTHIYAYDTCNNWSKHELTYSFENTYKPKTFSFNNHTYEVYNSLLSWSEAKTKCEELGGHLATITSQEEQNAIKQMIAEQPREGYFIGGYQSNNESKWVTEEVFEYTNWEAGQPNNCYDGEMYENIYIIIRGSGAWNDVVNKQGSYGFICEYEGAQDSDLPEDIPTEEIPEDLWIYGVNEDGYAYTGKAIKPVVRVYDGTTLLQEKTDYTIAYKNSTKANDASVEKTAPTITVTGKGNYSGKETVTFIIKPLDIGGEAFDADDLSLAYNKKEQKVVPTLLWNGKKLKNKTDFTVSWPETQEGAYKDPGTYRITLTGKGNFTGSQDVYLTITEDKTKVMSKASVSKIKDQSYTGSAIEPSITVKMGNLPLTKGTDYTIEYEDNTEVGTAYAVITGKGLYCGQKRISFKIKGTKISSAKVTGVPTTLSYTGEALTEDSSSWEDAIKLNITVGEETVTLQEGKDYTVSYSKNINVGTATVTFTAVGGYTGSVKKTFKITAYDMNREGEDKLQVEGSDGSMVVFYAKGGSKPKPEVKYGNTLLTEGVDYTLSYKNHTKVNDGSNSEKMPTVTIKGKGNFKGSLSQTFTIQKQSIVNTTISAPDKVYKNQKNAYKSTPKILDCDGKTLKAGTDYEKTFKYYYMEDVTLEDGTQKTAGMEVGTNDIVPTGAVLGVLVRGKGNYTDSVIHEYRIVKSDISKASVKVEQQVYTGSAVEPGKEDITVKVGKETLLPEDYEIVNYSNNVKKGNATITIKGTGNYGGTKTVKFTIKAKGFAWWWRSLF